MKSILTIFISTALFLISCKQQEKKDVETTSNIEITEKPLLNKNIFTVTLNATVKKDDSFQLYYKGDGQAAFDEKKSLFVEFKGSDQPQDIVFRLPEGEAPYFLRLDFGVNKEQSEILINKFRIDYLDKYVEIKGSDFSSYFYGNDLTVKIEPKTGKVTPFLTKDGGYDPMCASAEGLRLQIESLLK